MAAPVVVGKRTSQGNITTNHSVTLPGYAAGDYVVIQFMVANAGESLSLAGWTTLFTASLGGLSTYAYFGKEMTGSEGTSVTVTTVSAANSSHATFAVRGHSGAPSTTTATGTSANPDPAALSGLASGDYLFAVGYTMLGSFVSAPTNYPGPNSEFAGTIQNGYTAGWFSRTVDGVTGEDPGTFGQSSSLAYFCVTFGFKGSRTDVVGTEYTATNPTTTTTTNHSPTLPTGIVDGDVVLALCVTSGPSTTFTPPTGWTELLEQNVNSSFSMHAFIARKSAGWGTTFVSSGNVTGRWVVRAWKAAGTDPVLYDTAYNYGGSVSSLDIANLNTTGQRTWAVAAFGRGDSASLSAPYATNMQVHAVSSASAIPRMLTLSQYLTVNPASFDPSSQGFSATGETASFLILLGIPSGAVESWGRVFI